MTQPPDWTSLPYATPMPNPRPASVTAVAIIGIIMASLGLLCNGALVLAPGRMDTTLNAFFLLGFALSAVQLWASIDSLRLRRWARHGMIACAWVHLGSLAFTTVLAITSAVPQVGPTAVFRFLMVALLGSVFPVVILVVFTRPHVKRAFADSGS